jgi:hypothetical protein
MLLDLPPAVARAFKDMPAYFTEENLINRTRFAVRQLHALEQRQRPREKTIRLSDVKTMFLEMKGL